MLSVAERIAQLEAAIAAQQALRATLGDAIVAAAVAAMRTQLSALRAMPGAQPLDLHLHELQHADLIQRLALQPDAEYIFKHALTQDAAYGSLLFSERKALHAIVASALESAAVQRTGAQAGHIAEHYFRAEAWDKAAGYLVEAGDAAARVFAHPEARLYYARALDALSHLPETQDNRRRRVDAILKEVSVSLRAAGPDESLARLQIAETLMNMLGAAPALANSDRLRLARVYYWMGHAYLHGNRGRDAIAYMRKVLEAAEALGDEDLLAVPSAVVGRALALQGHFAKAEPLLRQALPPLARVANWQEWILSHVFLGVTLAAQGEVSTAIAVAEQGLARADALQYATGKGQCFSALAAIHGMAGDASLMRGHAQAALDVALAAGDRLIIYIGGSFLSWALSRLGEHTAARSAFEQAEQVGRQIGGNLVFSDWFAAARAEMALAAGEVSQAEKLAERAVARAREVNGVYAEALAQRTWAQVLMLQPARAHEADAHLAESLRLLESGHALLEAAHTHAAWGALCRVRKDEAGAREHFEQARLQLDALGIHSL